uniref:Uncharacterized protein n=1 Tax=Anopheles farauti TaxID=69004 RepID=A0A182Q1C7_9DIPT
MRAVDDTDPTVVNRWWIATILRRQENATARLIGTRAEPKQQSRSVEKRRLYEVAVRSPRTPNATMGRVRKQERVHRRSNLVTMVGFADVVSRSARYDHRFSASFAVAAITFAGGSTIGM